MRVSVRAYEAADFERLCQIEQQCFPPGMAFPPEVLAGFIGQRNAFTLVAVPEGSGDPIGGFLVGEQLRRTVGRIIALDVAPENRRHGWGSALLAVGEEHLRHAGCRQVLLEVAVNNEPALGLYRREGYLSLKTLPDYYPSHRLDAYQLGKRLNAPKSSLAPSSQAG